MKTRPGLIVTPLRLALLVAFGFSLMIAAGCVSQKSQKSKTAYNPSRPSPSVVSATEVLRQNSVRARTGELLQSGKYKNTGEARKAAEKEFGTAETTNDSAAWAEYAQWKRQRVSQTKFEAELDKMKRKP